MDCDASDYGLGAVISQRQDGYASRVLEDRERRYSATKKEMLAMVYAIKHFRHYLYGRPFTVRTDHNALKWLQSFKDPEGQVARWLETLAQYDYKIEHRPGKKHQNADALSRNPLPVPVTDQVVETNAVDSGNQTWLQGWTAADMKSKQEADPNLQHDVEDWCRQCEKWAKRKFPQTTARAPLVSSCPGYPFERIALDIMGPLPTTESGQKYILVVGDYFSKWTEAFPLPNQEAKTVAEKLVHEVIARYGAPEKIHSDQGRNFEAQLFQEMCILFNMDKTRTSPYHPESDGMIERMNRTLQDMLAKYVSHHQRDWDEHLPLVMMAYRSSIHASTQYTPFCLLFGHEMRLPIDRDVWTTAKPPARSIRICKGRA